MPRYIVKLHDDRDNTDYYCEWSTIVDAPVTPMLSREEFEKYYKAEYGENGFRDWRYRMSRVANYGTSAYRYTAAELIEVNKAGDDEKTLTLYELIDQYKP